MSNPSHSVALEKHLLGLLMLYPATLKDLSLTPDLFYTSINRTFFISIENYLKSNPSSNEILDPMLICIEANKLDPKITSGQISQLTDGVPKPSPQAMAKLVEKLVALSQKRELWKHTKKLEKSLEEGDDGAAEQWLEKIRTIEIGGTTPNKKSLADEVRDWVGDVGGEFSIVEIYKDLSLRDKNDHKNTSVILGRMVKDGLLRRSGKLNGRFRRVDKDCDEVDWRNAPTESLPFTFPLDIHDWVNIYGGNVIVIAGSQNSGKTAFCLNFSIANQDIYEINYFTSEMGATETKIRLELMDIPPDQVKVKFWERTDNFEDAVQPDAINIIDFLELNDEFYKVGSRITHIYEKLKGGIAVIALQKDINKEYGRGGSMGLERPRLYLAMNPGLLKIVKAKNWRGLDNPNGMTREFKLVNGWNFIPQGPWKRESYKEGYGETKAHAKAQPKGRFQI